MALQKKKELNENETSIISPGPEKLIGSQIRKEFNDNPVVGKARVLSLTKTIFFFPEAFNLEIII